MAETDETAKSPDQKYWMDCKKDKIGNFERGCSQSNHRKVTDFRLLQDFKRMIMTFGSRVTDTCWGEMSLFELAAVLSFSVCDESAQQGEDRGNRIRNVEIESEPDRSAMSFRSPEDISQDDEGHEHSGQDRDETVLLVFPKPDGCRGKGEGGEDLISPCEIVPELGE